MGRETALKQVQNYFRDGEELIDFFSAQKPLSIWWLLILGPLSPMLLNTYYVAVTDLGVYFFERSFLGKIQDHQFYSYQDIERLKVGEGQFAIPLKYFFKDGSRLLIHAQKRGTKRVAKIGEKGLHHLQSHIRAA